MKRMFQFLGLGCILLLCSLAAADTVKPQLPAEVDINKDAGRGVLLFVNVRLENGQEVPFCVDTGTARTLMDKSFEPTLGKPLGTFSMNWWGKKEQSRFYAAPKLYLGGIPLALPGKIVTSDLGRLASRSGPRLMGLIGFDCLKNYCIQLDFQKRKMRFLDPDHLDIADLGKAFPIMISAPGGRPFIKHPSLLGEADTNSPTTTDADSDPNNRGLPSTYALIDSGFYGDGRVSPGEAEGHDSGKVRVPECVWNGETYTNLIIEVADHANLIGLRFLARHLVTLDFPHRTMYLKQISVGPLQP